MTDNITIKTAAKGDCKLIENAGQRNLDAALPIHYRNRANRVYARKVSIRKCHIT